MVEQVQDKNATQAFAFFDFDDTLLKHDSMFFLVLYYIRKHPLSFWRCFWILLLGVLYLCKIIPFKIAKEAILFPLDKMTDEEIKTFYQEELVKRFYPNVLKVLEQHALNGVHVWIVSASPEAYLLCTDLPVEKVIGTSTLRKDDRWTSRMTSKNCKGEEKVSRIKEELKKMNLEIDYDHSYGYSDSNSDWPMLALTANRYRINKKNGAISPFQKRA